MFCLWCGCTLWYRWELVTHLWWNLAALQHLAPARLLRLQSERRCLFSVIRGCEKWGKTQFPSISSSPFVNKALESGSRLSSMLIPLSEFMANPDHVLPWRGFGGRCRILAAFTQTRRNRITYSSWTPHEFCPERFILPTRHLFGVREVCSLGERLF